MVILVYASEPLTDLFFHYNVDIDADSGYVFVFNSFHLKTKNCK